MNLGKPVKTHEIPSPKPAPSLPAFPLPDKVKVPA